MPRKKGKKSKWIWRRFIRKPLSKGSKWAVRLALLSLLPLVFLNGAVSLIGQTLIFPLSTRHLNNKWQALTLFIRHVPTCIAEGHGNAPNELIRQTEDKYGLPPGLLAALIQVESRGLPHRISPTGAMGLGQMMPATAKMIGVVDPYDSPQAIEGSARYLSRQLAQFKDLKLALAAYNAGPGNVRRGKIPKNGETERYVPKVLAEFQRRQAHGPANPPAAYRSFSDPGAAESPKRGMKTDVKADPPSNSDRSMHKNAQ